jgi:pilus assembly protein CpaC
MLSRTASTRMHRSFPRLAACLVFAGTLFAASPASAGVSEAQLTITPASYGATRPVQIEINKSMLIDLPAGVSEVIVSQPAIAAGIMRTRTRAILQGLAEGTTNVIFLDDAGRTMAVLDVKVLQAASELGSALEATLARVIPGSNIRVEALSDSAIDGTTHFVLTGTVLTAEDKAVAEALAADLSDDDEAGSLIRVIGPQQVMLQVTVSEVQRDVAKQFGINLSGALSVGNVNLNFNNNVTASGLNTNNGLNATGIGIGDLNINAAIRALETRGGLRVLAQPTLTAISGQEATFLAGGEIPYATTDSLGNQTVVFRPYGVELAFSPVVRANGMISLAVNTSVSEPQTSGSLTKRQASTSVELPAGTTLAIGGLLQESTRQQIDQFPGLGDIPILGALFRSRDFQSQQTELVILVTPYLVQPSPAGTIPVPTDTSVAANDAEGIFLGKIEKIYGVAGSGDMRGSFSGQIGFVLD